MAMNLIVSISAVVLGVVTAVVSILWYRRGKLRETQQATLIELETSKFTVAGSGNELLRLVFQLVPQAMYKLVLVNPPPEWLMMQDLWKELGSCPKGSTDPNCFDS